MSTVILRALPRAAALLAPLALLACKAPDPAPTELEDLTHYFLLRYDDAEPEALIEGIDNLERWYEAEVGEGDLGGTLEDVTREALDSLDMPDDVDPSEVVGVFHLTPQTCSLDDAAAVFLYPQQDELFDGTYISYAREFRGDPDCFLSGGCDEVVWDTHVVSNLALNIEMDYALVAGVRWVEDPEGERPTTLMSRTHMPEPGLVEGVAYFDQSYQIEVFIPWGDGQTVHLYGLWNSGGAEGLDPEADFWKDQYLNGLIDYNAQLDALCQTRAEWDG